MSLEFQTVHKKRKIEDGEKHLGMVMAGDHHAGTDVNAEFVYPWMGIAANIPDDNRNGQDVRSCGSKVKNDLTMKEFNPMTVQPF